MLSGVDAQNLKAGYKLLSENNRWQTVKGVTIKAEKLSAYNLTVETDHTYFIKGTNSDLDGVWVHNNCWNSLPADAVRTGKLLQMEDLYIPLKTIQVSR